MRKIKLDAEHLKKEVRELLAEISAESKIKMHIKIRQILEQNNILQDGYGLFKKGYWGQVPVVYDIRENDEGIFELSSINFK